jgi:hypothetical protein
VVGHNIHKNVNRIQEEGTSIVMFGGLTDYFDAASSGRDPTGLGRWVVMTVKVEVQTRIVCRYNPCGNDKPHLGTVYHQHRRYWITQRKFSTCPRVKFWEDLIRQLKEWREAGDKLIICFDANEDVYNKSLGKTLTSIDGLGMQEVVGQFTQKKLGATFFRSSKPIDAIWATTDVQVTGACILPAGYGVGDHRLFVIDLAANSVLGQFQKKCSTPILTT